MRFTTPCFIRKNSKELQKKLADIGYSICRCANFANAEWLDTFPINGTVHGKGYFDAEMEFHDWTVEKELNRFLSDNHSYIDCGTNEELFLAIAALRDDYDCNQYFWYKDELFKCIGGGSTVLMSGDYSIKLGSKLGYFDVMKSKLRKATVEELINHFK